MPKILVVEDESDIRELIVFTLNFSGFEAVSAANGEEALQMAVEEDYDLILLDVRMPRLSGYDTCKQMRKMEQTKNTPIVFLSAKGQEHEMQEGLAAGADQYILKPFAPTDLTQAIQKILTDRTVKETQEI